MKDLKCSLLFVLVGIIFLSFPSWVEGHATMTLPRARGALNQEHYKWLPWVVSAAEKEYSPHCLNAKAVGVSGAWRPYEPMNKKIPFRHDFGLCGDEVSKPQPRDNEKGGKYSAPASFPYSAVYQAGSVVQFEVGISTSHQGFFEFYVCDVGKCGGDISEKCFQHEHCRLLERAPNAECDSGKSKHCGPKDPAYPGRWVMPCKKKGETFRYGGKYMTYQLPSGFDCKDCVIQWYWATANSCNPPGFSEYFEKFPMKAWAGCPGDGGTTGGVQMTKAKCGPQKPEEFWNCADVRITSERIPAPDYSQTVEYSRKMDGEEVRTAPYGEVLEILMAGGIGKRAAKAFSNGRAGKGARKTPPPARRDDNGDLFVEDKKGNFGAPMVTAPPRASPNPPQKPGADPRKVDEGKKKMASTSQKRRPGGQAGTQKCVKKWQQCGGRLHKGPTHCCAPDVKCVEQDEWYHQCKPPASN